MTHRTRSCHSGNALITPEHSGKSFTCYLIVLLRDSILCCALPNLISIIWPKSSQVSGSMEDYFATHPVSTITTYRHVYKYPTMHYFEIPRHTQSMITYEWLIEFLSGKFRFIIVLWESSLHAYLVLFVNHYYIVNVHDMMRIARASLYKGLTPWFEILFPEREV